METGIRVDDDGCIYLGSPLGKRRLKAMLFLAQHPEMDDEDWEGRYEFHCWKPGRIKAVVVPNAVEIRD